MVFAVLGLAGVVLGLVHVALEKQPKTPRRVADLLLTYAFVFPMGLGGLLGFVGHTLRAVPVAASIGWPAGNPFQYEVAVANLAFGVLGILCLWFHDGFRTASAIGWIIFILGAATVHLHQIHIGQPYAPANAGAMLYFDIVTPVYMLALLTLRGAKG